MNNINNIPFWWNEALNHLSKSDKIMEKIIMLYPDASLNSRGDPFMALSRTIVGQQISVKAAASVRQNIEANIKTFIPKNIIQYGIKNLRKCGTSERKAEYLVNIANYFITNPNIVKELERLSDREVVDELCKLKGIGPWSAEMFLIFCLLRQDILPMGDLGLRKGIGINYLNKKNPSDNEIKKISKSWRPYRSAATWFLWRSIDPITIAY